MRRLLTICAASSALAVAFALGLGGGISGPLSTLPLLSTPSAAAAPDPEGSGAIVALGRALRLRTSDGRVVAVTVLGVRMRAGRKRLVDVHVRYRLRQGKRYREDVGLEAQLVDGTGQMVLPAATGLWRRPALGPALLHAGQARTGWITFALPTAAGAVRVQVTLDASTAPHTGQWRVPRL